MKIDLVLGSGAARGIAHIGVLRELEARGHEVVRISGTSMGALVGGAYACGTLDLLEEIVRTTGLRRALWHIDVALDGSGVMAGHRVHRLLRALYSGRRIEELPLPVSVTTVDLTGWEEVVLTEGSLAAAVHASIAIPGLFAPVRSGRRVLVDGSLTTPLPIPSQRHPEADVLLSVSALGAPEEAARRRRKPLRFLPGILTSTFDILLHSVEGAALTARPPGIHVDLPANITNNMAFHRRGAVIDAGRGVAAAAFDLDGL
ncbi:MAG: patatin-like phospholipase family protein [Brachybacterium sp.]|uniref:patatin-like phospholipase family protein n=1 Tax=Brachybacterium sp. TaxID=1891286 RepID=UPI0026507894|nr:patatin-like phospholipase family protein [Brachybacterium sp.]